MTREEATKQALSLGLSGQALQQKVEELMGNTASDFSGGTASEYKSPLQKQAEQMGAVQAQAIQPAKNYKPEVKTDEKPSMAKFGEFGQKLEDSFNQEDLTASGDELEEQLTGQSTAAQNQAVKPGEKAERRLAEEGKTLPEETKQAVAAEAATGVKAGETATVNKNDSTEDKNAKKRYNQSTMSIWDAYNNGLIDKETAGYFTVDALATLAKNLGRGIGNVGAQFSGGTIDQGHDASMWEQRKDEIFNQELTGEAEGIQNYANTMKKYNLNRASTINDLLNAVKADVDKLDDKDPAKIAYLALAVQMAHGDIDGTTTLAGVGAKAAAPLLEKLEGLLGGKK